MRDLFDDFMDELAVARRPRAARTPARHGPTAAIPNPIHQTTTPTRTTPSARGDRDDEDTEDRDPGDVDADADDREADEDDADSAEEPQRIDEASRRRRRRSTGGPNDGGSSRAARAGRRFGIAAFAFIALAVFLLFSVGLDVWTDALWYGSVGFDSVFWTRLLAIVGLGAAAFLVALVVFLANLWLAGRLAPPPSGDGGSFRSLFDRLNEAAPRPARRGATARPRSGDWGNRGEVPGSGARPVVFEAPDLPDLTPMAGWILGGMAVFFAIVIGGSVSGAWETVLLWINRVPFSPTASRHRPDLQP